MTGAIVARPGAEAQRFHCDADNGHLFWSTLLPRHRMYALTGRLNSLNLAGPPSLPSLGSRAADTWS